MCAVSAVLSTLLVVAVASAAAATVHPGLDRSFGHDGRVALHLPLPPGASEFGAVSRVAASDGSSYVLAIAVDCDPACVHRRQLLYRFGPDGKLYLVDMAGSRVLRLENSF